MLWYFVLEEGTESTTAQGGPLEIVGGRGAAPAVGGRTQRFCPGLI